MNPANLTRPLPKGLPAPVFRLAHCRLSERVVLGFFLYTATLCFAFDVPIPQKVIGCLAPVVIFGFASLETVYSTTESSIARDWALPAAVLMAYWQMGWFTAGHESAWQHTWLQWDRQLLDDWGLRALIEGALPVVPWVLELTYLSLYAIPPVCLGILYWRRERCHVDRFLTTFALGTLTAYALLPFIPVESPRTVFPTDDLPAVTTLWRGINLWILDHLDISTSVFPSGHVAVAFSSAFGIRRAIPGVRPPFQLLLLLAGLIFVATIYGRYHYAADGLASILISLLAWIACEAHDHLA